ncbi:MAG TPA: LacI family DNA-binding transcriptional regulator [Fimbriimonas sp.]|nr:LacI family DNA-binding transcriptional regulator [Fimbriimonas sp.]
MKPVGMKSYGELKSTITQVAALAGVSVTTVSLYLKGNKRVCSERTAARIDLAVQQLNYQPNPLAGWACSRERRTVGLLASDDLERGNTQWNVYNMRIVAGIIEAANENDYSVLTYPYRVFMEQRYRAVLDGRVDALLFYGTAEHDFVKRVVDAGMPVICFGTPESVGAVMGSAHADEASISNLSLDHLWSLGHRHIAHMAGPYDDCVRLGIEPNGELVERREAGESVSRARLDAAVSFLADRGALNPEWISPPNAWRNALVTGTLEEWWSRPQRPTAIYCANDFIALEVLFWARERGLEVPRDVAIIGVDNIQSTSVEPVLSSVEFSVEGIGREAFHALLDYQQGRDPRENHRVMRAMRLVARTSTVGKHSPPVEFELIKQTIRPYLKAGTPS